MGSSELEGARVDAIVECVRDIKTEWQKVKRTEDAAARTEAKKEWFASTFPAFCSRLERCLPGGDATSWCVGSEPSLADVCVYHLLSTPVALVSGATVSFFDGEAQRVRDAFETTCPRLHACVLATGNLPPIRDC